MITAVQRIRGMQGGAHSHLMLASDGHAYVVKFQNNPQGTRVLAADYLGTRLAGLLGFTVPACEVVNVPALLVESTRELVVINDGGEEVPCRAGRQFGSRLVGGLMPGKTVNFLPEPLLGRVQNLLEFAGILVFDKWTCNHDGRQAVFTKRSNRHRYKVTFIDQGYCFTRAEWHFQDSPLRGVYARNLPYTSVTGWDNFEPWMSRLEKLDAQAVWREANAMPQEWYDGATSKMEQLVEQLMVRRSLVPQLIESFRSSHRKPFPNWARSDVFVHRNSE